ncbi:MAG: hypothetical protein Q7V40_20160 [Pseudolabrys sp.]|nr:hypothetical protein [Pseudolabrys sp.]
MALTTRELTVGAFNTWTPSGASAVRRALATLKADKLASCTARRWRLHKALGQTKRRKPKKSKQWTARQGRDELAGQEELPL